MNRRAFLYAAVASTSTLVFGALLIPAQAGGFGIFADLPRPGSPAQLQDSVFIVHPDVYHLPGAKVTVTLEGIQNGKRVTRELTPVQFGSGRATYLGIGREWPSEGRWVVSVAATTEAFAQAQVSGKPVGDRIRLQRVAFIPINPDGSPRTRPTPGGKYDRVLTVVDSSYPSRWKTLATLLRN